MDEAAIIQSLKNWAKPDEAFREELLQRCLAEFCQPDSGCLDDADIEMLAAAGDNPADSCMRTDETRPWL